jgi:hypothetical protein
VNIAKSNQLAKYINDKCIPSTEVDEFDPVADPIALDIWLKFQAGDTNMQLAITTNCKAIAAQVCQGKKSALEI